MKRKMKKIILGVLFQLMIVTAGFSLSKVTAKAEAVHYLRPYQTGDMEIYDNDDSEHRFTMMGDTFLHGLSSRQWDGIAHAEFALDRKVSVVSFVIGHLDDDYNDEGTLKIYLDGVIQDDYTQDLTGDMLNQTVTINTAGCQQLEIDIDGYHPRYGIGNITESGMHNYECQITKMATVREDGLLTYVCRDCGNQYTKSDPKKTYCTNELIPYQSESMEQLKENFGSSEYASVRGKRQYRAFLSQQGGGSSNVFFNLNLAYQSISFSVGHRDDDYSDDGTLNVYLDGMLVKTIGLTHKMLIQKINIPTTAVTQLKIEIDGYHARYVIYDLQGTPVTPVNKPHSFEDQVLAEADFGTTGIVRHECTVCGAYYTTITPALTRTLDTQNVSVTLSESSYTYNGKAKNPAVTVRYGDDLLVENRDYKLTYTNNVKPGKATVTITGMGGYKGSISKTYTIYPPQKMLLTSAKITLSTSSYTYNGKAKNPAVTVRYGGNLLVENRDYKLTYTNNVKPGKATVTITGMGEYEGRTSKTYIICPRKMTLTSVKSKKKKQITVKWKKDSLASGYELQYSKYRNFHAKKKKIIAKKGSVRLSGLARKTTYYVRIRSYKTVNGKKYYGSYSKVKKVKVK